MRHSVRGEDYRRTTVCVDSYENGVPIGRLYHRHLPEGKQFHGVTHFLQEMETVLDEADFPRAFTELRRFSAPTEIKSTVSASEQKRGDISTFTIRILFRQNASWQGSVLWQEGGQEQCFRSVLELILLLDNALSYQSAGASWAAAAAAQ